jgi:Zn-dependent peptidase ImmA (M78 family)/transcriptional regulator with XRE-family HTH domain
MPQSPPAVVTPAVLRWARESLGLTQVEAAHRVGVNVSKLEAAEVGEAYLTMRQAEAAARLYERPLAALFLSEPPAEEPLEAQFRRLPGAPALPWPPAMRSLSRRIRSRQEAAADLYDALDDEPPWQSVEITYDHDPEAMAARVREVLGITLDEQCSWLDRSGYTPLREWVDAIEGLGVLVMQDGTLEVDDMRGFASTHPSVPAVVVNTKDDPRARAFTALHELGHLIRVAAGRATGRETEEWCNTFASAVLMPAGEYAADFRGEARSLLVKVDLIATRYGVTSLAAAVRASRLQLAPRDDLDNVIDAIRRRSAEHEEGQGGGGDYYRTTVGRLGPSYIQLVLSALDSQVLTYPGAAGLLGVKVNNFENLRDRVRARAAG